MITDDTNLTLNWMKRK